MPASPMPDALEEATQCVTPCVRDRHERTTDLQRLGGCNGQSHDREDGKLQTCSKPGTHDEVGCSLEGRQAAGLAHRVTPPRSVATSAKLRPSFSSVAVSPANVCQRVTATST